MLTPAPDSDAMTPSGPDLPSRAGAALARDAALARVGSARRLTILGAAGLSAGFAALVSTSPPSKASTASAKRSVPATLPSTTTPGARSGEAPALPPLAGGSQLGLAGPSQSPGSDDGSGAAAPPAAPSQTQPDQSAAAAPAPSQQPGPVSGGS